jgi:hypothetical protein
MSTLERVADALERIADALEKETSSTPAPIVLSLDGKALAQSVMSYTISQAARGPSSLRGGSLHGGTG